MTKTGHARRVSPHQIAFDDFRHVQSDVRNQCVVLGGPNAIQSET